MSIAANTSASLGGGTSGAMTLDNGS